MYSSQLSEYFVFIKFVHSGVKVLKIQIATYAGSKGQKIVYVLF